MKPLLGLVLLLLLLKWDIGYCTTKTDQLPSKYHQVDAVIARSRQLVVKNADSARLLAEQALVISKKINYKLGIGQCFDVIGKTYWAQSFLPVSQFYLLMAIPYLKGNNIELAACYKDIGRNYVDLKDYSHSLYYFNASLKLVGNSAENKADVYTQFASMYTAKGDYDNGLKSIDTAFKYCRLTNKPDLEAILYNRLGQIYISKKQPGLARRAIDTAYKLTFTTHNTRLRTITIIGKAGLALMGNNLQEASNYAKKGLMLADTLGSYELKLRVLKLMVQVAEKQRDLKQLDLIQKMIISINERSAKIDFKKSMDLVQDYLLLNNKLSNIELANKNNADNKKLIGSQNRTIVLLVVCLMIAITFLIVIFIYYYQKNQMNAQLQQQHKVLIDQKKLIETQRTDLEEVNKLKDKLLAIIGHDLRTPLASLSSIAELFAANYITAEEVTKLMIDLTPIIKGAELTLSNLMEFAGSQLKGQNVAASDVNMFLITVEVKKTFEHQLLQKNINFVNNCLFESNVWADSNHVKVIVRNLVSNAIKFTNNDGEITVSSVIKDNQMVVSIQDTGVGMTKAEIDKLFDVNQHFSHRGTSGEKGTGLGLLLCKELVELNKGKLWVEAKEGLGCCFSFSLPRLSASAK
jgi:signal transduction histidine kinase